MTRISLALLLTLILGLALVYQAAPLRAAQDARLPGGAVERQPQAPTLALEPVGQFGGALVHSVAVGGQAGSGPRYAYVGIANRLVILDVSNPEQPALLGRSEAMPEPARDIRVVGSRAYLAVGAGGLFVMDVRDPRDPRLIGTLPLPGVAEKLTIRGHRAYVAALGAGLQIVDVSDPAAPRLLGGFDTPGAAADVSLAVQEGSPRRLYAYVADVSGGLQIVDVTRAAAPRLVSALDTEFDLRNVTVVGGMAYGIGDVVCERDCNSGGGLRVIDVSDPRAPRESEYYHRTGGDGQEIFVAGELLYVILSPRLIHSFDSSTHYAGAALTIFDLSDPHYPTVLAGYDTPGSSEDGTVAGGLAFIADGFGGLEIVDVSQPDALTHRGTYDSPAVNALDLLDGRAYLVGETLGYDLHIVDVSEPAAPRALGRDYTGLWGQDVEVEGSAAYLTGQNQSASDAPELEVFDVRDPARPGRYPPIPGVYGAADVSISDGLAFVAATWGGLDIADVSNPMSPTLLSTIDPDTGYFPYAVEAVGALAYVAVNGPELSIVDASDPENPEELSRFGTHGGIYDMEVVDGLAFVAEGDVGLQLLRVADPAAPRNSGRIDTPGIAQGVAVSGTQVFVADGNAGVHIVDVSQPSEPRLVTTYDTPGQARKVRVVGDLVYVADGTNGLLIFRLTNAPAVTPTPTASTTATPSLTATISPSPTLTTSPTATATLTATTTVTTTATTTVTATGEATLTATATPESTHTATTTPPATVTTTATPGPREWQLLLPLIRRR